MTHLNTLRWVLLIGASLCFGSCGGLISDCGGKATLSDSGTGADISTWDNLGVSDDLRIFHYSRKVENVCPHEHVKTQFRITVSSVQNPLPVPLTVEGRVEYDLLLAPDRTLLANKITSPGEYSGATDSGLSQSFGDQVAQFWVVYVIMIPTTFDLQEDLQMVQSLIENWSYSAEYQKF